MLLKFSSNVGKLMSETYLEPCQTSKDGVFLQKWLTAFNTLTTNYEYSRSDRENLPLPIQMQLSEKLKPFSGFLEYTLNFEHFEKKDEPHSSSIYEVTDSERRAYLNA